MCGIAGVVALEPGPTTRVDRALLERLARSMVHRGPDADGFHLADGVGFAFRRLSILDVAGGDQPIANEDGTVTVVFNGEIYNFGELTEQLGERGHVFRTRSDTEVLVHGYEEWGARGLCERLRGMFAFALHDARARRVVLARDRLGKKPLHVAEHAGRLWFASELKTLLEVPGLPRSLDPQAVVEYATLGYVGAPRSIFSAVRKLEPARLLVVEDGRARTERYWAPSFAVVPRGMDEASQRVLALLREAVRIRLQSEVPLGCFLSGGLDSSAVAAAMVEARGTGVNAVTIGFAEPEFDESAAAARVAAHLGVTPIIEAAEPATEVLDGVAATFDEPHADPSNVPTWLLCQAARRRVTVALSGDGGDELFGGYRRYAYEVLEDRLRRLLPRGFRERLLAPFGEWLPKGDAWPRPLRAKTLVQNLAREPVEAYLRSVSRILPDDVESLVAPDVLAAAGAERPLDRMRDLDRAHGLSDPLLRARALDLQTWLPDDILVKVDRASMAHSLEVRAPFLDHRLVELAASLPPGLLLRGGAGKRVLKHAVRGLLPRDVLERRKRGFEPPVKSWLDGPLRAEVDALAASDSPLAAWFRLERVSAWVAEHRAGRRDRSAALWLLVVFARWHRRWSGGRGA